MSLINDALRRTSQSQAPPAIPAETPPLRPVDPSPSQTSLALVLAPVIILLLGLAGWFWVKWWESSIQVSQNSNPGRVAAREISRASGPRPAMAQDDELTPLEPVARGSAPGGFLPLRQNARPGSPPELPARAAIPAPAVAPSPLETSIATVPTNIPQAPTIAIPTIAPDVAKPATPKFKLQGIFYRPANPSAVINGKVVYIGDKVEQARVLAIEKDEVSIEYQGQKSVLSLQ